MKDKIYIRKYTITIHPDVQINNANDRTEFTIGKCKVAQGNHHIDEGWVDFEVSTKEA